MKKRAVVASISVTLSGLGHAQPGAAEGSSLATLTERRGYCSAQKKVEARARCYEELATAALRLLEEKSVPPPVPAPPVVVEGPHAAFVRQAKANITANIKDPATVQFRNLTVVQNKMKALCGEINARNSCGAYVGFRKFYATSHPMLQEVENPRDNFVFERSFPGFCAGGVADTVED